MKKNKTKILESLDRLETFVNKATKDELINAFGLDKGQKGDFNPYAFLEDYIVNYNSLSSYSEQNKCGVSQVSISHYNSLTDDDLALAA